MSQTGSVRPWYRRMTARRPDEPHRSATPLELFFDLCFVVAVAQAAAACTTTWPRAASGTRWAAT